jgi:ribose-phosphate pyrophosphokinase
MDLKSDQVPVVFAMNGATAMARGVEAWIDANWLPGFRLAEKEERRRHDRESYIRSKINVRGRKVYLIDSFATDPDEAVDEKIWGSVLFVSSLKDASCADVTLLGTMFPYMRQDQKDQPRAAINTAAFVRQMWAAGVQRLITIDVHNPAAVQNAAAALKMNFDHLEARCPLARAVADELPRGARYVVLTPDLGATKRTKAFQGTLQRTLSRRFGGEVRVGFAHANKNRVGDTESQVTTIIEDPAEPIAGALVIVPDDILATGNTLCEIQQVIAERGGTMFAACVTHGLFTGRAAENLERIERIYTTNTVSPWRLAGTPTLDRVRMVDVADIFAQAIRETHVNGSINRLLTSLEEGGTASA